jgi:uncharacterized protein (TIGR04255 family)
MSRIRNADALPLGEICYQRNYIDQAIIRLDFAVGIDKLNTSLPKDIRDTALGIFPILEPRKGIGQQFVMTFGVDDQSQKSQRSNSTQTMNWIFHDDRKVKSLDLSASAIVIVVSEFSRYDNMRTDFMTVANEVFRIFPNCSATRLGMRFVNNIKMANGENPLDWEQYLNPNLLGSLANIPQDAKVVRSLNSLELKFPECNLKVQSGMLNPDYPAAVRRKEFVLDLDAHRAGVIEPGEVEDALNSFHRRIQDYFEGAITQNLRNLMNE